MVASSTIDKLGACLGSLRLDPRGKSAPQYRFVSLDLETTSLIPSKGRIIELAAVDIESGDFYETLINPAPVTLSKKTFGITGIRATDVTAPDVPNFQGAFEGFLAFAKRCRGEGETLVLVAHNGARFDFSYLRNECARNGLELPDDWLFVDTLLLAQHFGLKDEVESGSLSQDSLRAWLQVPEPLVKHRALPDAQVLAAMFPRLLERLGNPSMADLLAKKKRLAGLMSSVAVSIQLETDTPSPLLKWLDSLLPSTRILTAREFVRNQLEDLIHCSASPNNTSHFQLFNIANRFTSPCPTPGASTSRPSPVYVLLQGVKVEYTIHKLHAYKGDGMTPHWNLLLSGESPECTDALVAFGLACDGLTRHCQLNAQKLHSAVKALHGSTALKVALRTKLQDGEVSLHTHLHDVQSQSSINLEFSKYENPRDADHVSSIRSANVDTVNSTLKRHTVCDLLVCPEFVWSSSIGCGVKLTAVHMFLHGGSATTAAPKARSAPAKSAPL